MYAIIHTCHCDTPSSPSPSVPSPSPVLPSAAAPSPGPPLPVVKVSSECVPTSSLEPIRCDRRSQLSLMLKTGMTQISLEAAQGKKGALLVFPDSFTVAPEAVSHYRTHCGKIPDWTESPGGKVALGKVSGR